MIKEAIGTLAKGKALTRDEASLVMEEIMDGKATQAQLGAFLTALSIKGETSDEIAGLAKVMRDKAVRVNIEGPVLDIVGTGGDGLNTINISTAAAFVIAGAGVKVAKHGNRAATGKCGSADVLEKLGIVLSLTSDQVAQCIREIGISFMFAPAFHPAMKHASGPRREIGIRTVFNILGPLTNPAYAEHIVLGVPTQALAEKIVPALLHLDIRHALVVCGLNGMDELSISGKSLYWEVKNGTIITSAKSISPGDFGLSVASEESIRGGMAEDNAAILKNILAGQPGPQRDIIVLNAAAALLAADRADSWQQGMRLSQESIDTGKAQQKLSDLILLTQKLTGIKNDSTSNSAK